MCPPRLDLEGKPSNLTLRRLVKGHHRTEGFWERMLSYVDRLSTIAGRFRLEYDY